MSTDGHWRNRIVGIGEEAPDQLMANPLNWRVHPKFQQAALEGSLSEIGWIDQIIVNRRTGHVVDGHLRVTLAMRRNEPTVPVLYVDLSEKEEKLALVTLDPIASLAAADSEKLAELLAEVRTDSEAVKALLADMAMDAGIDWGKPPPEDAGAQIDQAEKLREKWGVERGQVWEIGKHRVMCGDSTLQSSVQLLLGDAIPQITVTDPPYGVGYDPAWRQEAAEQGLLAYAPSRIGPVRNDESSDWALALLLCPGDVCYCWHADRHASITQNALQAAGFEMRCQIIWAKPHFPISRGHYHWRHEPCWYAVRKGKTARWIGDRKQTTLWEIPLDRNVEGGHSTQKPVECMLRPLRNHQGDVYDPFLGSGTTMVAAEQTGRVCYGMDIEPKYVAVTLERMAGMGLEPRLIDV